MSHGPASYPHPVLGNSDDILPADLAVSVDYEVRDELLTLGFRGLRTGNASLDDLAEAGLAHWMARVQCGSTYYRQCFPLTGPEDTVLIDARQVRSLVEVEVELCAREHIMAYAPIGAHEDYGGASFVLESGDILATAGTSRLSVEKVFDPLKATAASIMRVVEGEHADGPFVVVLDTDLIEVQLSKGDWERWNAVKDSAPGLLHSTVVLPALMHAIERRRDFEGTRWADRIEALLASLPSRLAGEQPDPLTLAQSLLGHPTSRGLDEVLRIFEEEV